MRIETNDALVKRNRRIAQYLFFVTLGALILGFVLVNGQAFFGDIDEQTAVTLSFALPLIVLPVAFVFTVFSIRMTNLWLRVPRPEKALEENLKGIGKQAVLYNYFHFPARHVLITPAGVFALTTRYQNGRFSVTGDKWRAQRNPLSHVLTLLRMDGILDPSADAKLGAEKVDALLADINPDVPVYPVVLFSDPRAEVIQDNPSVVVLYISNKRFPNLKDFVKEQPKSPHALTPEQIKRFEDKFLKR
jgi:hypothetical protein